MKYRIYYMKPEWFGQGILGHAEPNPHNLKKTHTAIAVIEADNLDQVFTKMQGEVWSPNGEARDLILALGLQHTSMSVGDVAIDEFGDIYLVDIVGFRKIGSLK